MVITMLEEIKAVSDEKDKEYRDTIEQVIQIMKDGGENPDTTQIAMAVTQLIFTSHSDEQKKALVSSLTVLLYEQSLRLNAEKTQETDRRPAGFSAN